MVNRGNHGKLTYKFFKNISIVVDATIITATILRYTFSKSWEASSCHEVTLN